MSYPNPAYRIASPVLNFSQPYTSQPYIHSSPGRSAFFNSVSNQLSSTVLYKRPHPCIMSSSNDSLSTKSPSEQRNHDAISSGNNQSEGVLATVKEQIHFATGGRSISEFGSEVSSVVGETVQDTKDAVAPLAENAIHTVQTRVRSLTENTNPEDAGDEKQATDPAVDETEHKKIDQLDNEHICDFLREKHMSTKPPPTVRE